MVFLKMDLKRFLCSEDSKMGKVVVFFESFLADTTIEIDVRDSDVIHIACPCCMFWRGVMLGGAVAAALGVLCAWVF